MGMKNCSKVPEYVYIRLLHNEREETYSHNFTHMFSCHVVAICLKHVSPTYRTSIIQQQLFCSKTLTIDLVWVLFHLFAFFRCPVLFSASPRPHRHPVCPVPRRRQGGRHGLHPLHPPSRAARAARERGGSELLGQALLDPHKWPKTSRNIKNKLSHII